MENNGFGRLRGLDHASNVYDIALKGTVVLEAR
jgi:hypothetical protein